MSDVSHDPAVQVLVETLYADLRALARGVRRRSPTGSDTLQTTALVHEAYLKLAAQPVFRGRAHFLATAALAMRHVLVSHARARLAEKRGSGQHPLPLDYAVDAVEINDARVLALNDALNQLEVDDPRAARVVECRYFAGLTEAETALALGVTDRTVQRDWAKAKALLYEALAL